MKTRSVAEDEIHLLKVIRGQRFLKMEGLSNEVPFFIYPYKPEDASEVAQARRRIKSNLRKEGIEVLEISLYELAIEILKERGVWERLLELESQQTKSDFREILQGMLDPEQHIAPAVRRKLAEQSYDVFFLTGIGEVFPYIRSHNILNNLQSVSKDKPMLMFFPGTYAQSETMGSSLVLFGQLKDDQYYRAKNIIDQEA